MATRLSRDERRAQLLDVGRAMASRVALDEISTDDIADAAGISRGLLFHYFDSRHDFLAALVASFTDELLERTAPAGGEPLDQLRSGIERYLDYVTSHRRAYLSLVRGGAGGRADVQEIVERTRGVQVDRLLTGAGVASEVATPQQRYLARGFVAMVEDVTLRWLERRDLEPDELVSLLIATGGLFLEQLEAGS